MLVRFRDLCPSANASLVPWGVPSEVAAKAAKAAASVSLGHLLPFDEGMALMGGQDATGSLDKARSDLGIEFEGFTRSFATYGASL
jgi:hypothetical protein